MNSGRSTTIADETGTKVWISLYPKADPADSPHPPYGLSVGSFVVTFKLLRLRWALGDDLRCDALVGRLGNDSPGRKLILRRVRAAIDDPL
jgi:hypothetical protein